VIFLPEAIIPRGRYDGNEGENAKYAHISVGQLMIMDGYSQGQYGVTTYPHFAFPIKEEPDTPLACRDSPRGSKVLTIRRNLESIFVVCRNLWYSL
jgi:hypothetical protein